MKNSIKKATFAGGCFWCMVKPFDQWDGIHSVVSGFTGGHLKNPTYQEVKKGNTGHREAVEITFDESVISYQQIVDIFWVQIDPTDDGGQFQDRGEAYRAAIFYHDDLQKQVAMQSKDELIKSHKFQDPIVTEILPAAPFYPAEAYHQDFYKTNHEAYKKDREQSGRDEFIAKTWQSEATQL